VQCPKVVDGDDGRKINNPLTQGTSCPPGFKSVLYGRVRAPENPSSSENLWACYNSSLPLGNSILGGFYQKADGGSVDNVLNPFTSATSCPDKYSAYQVGRIRTPENLIGGDIFVCLNDVFSSN